MKRFLSVALLGATSLLPGLVPVTLKADEHIRTYQDKDHNDEHHWNTDEDRAYRRWAKENHQRYRAFDKLPDRDQQNYWTWRHEHPDSDKKAH